MFSKGYITLFKDPQKFLELEGLTVLVFPEVGLVFMVFFIGLSKVAI